jgi:hypothetical protein
MRAHIDSVIDALRALPAAGAPPAVSHPPAVTRPPAVHPPARPEGGRSDARRAQP